MSFLVNQATKYKVTYLGMEHQLKLLDRRLPGSGEKVGDRNRRRCKVQGAVIFSEGNNCHHSQHHNKHNTKNISFKRAWSDLANFVLESL